MRLDDGATTRNGNTHTRSLTYKNKNKQLVLLPHDSQPLHHSIAFENIGVKFISTKNKVTLRRIQGLVWGGKGNDRVVPQRTIVKNFDSISL